MDDWSRNTVASTTVRASAIAQRKGHIPFLIFRYLSLSYSDFESRLRVYCSPEVFVS